MGVSFPRMEPLHAFRTIEIPIELRDGTTTEIRVPFTLQLMERVEETIFAAEKKPWFRLKPKEPTIREAFIAFCRHYLPADFDYAGADPTFPAVFFSYVRDELKRSIEACMNSTNDTAE